MQIEMDVLGGLRFAEADIFRGAGKLENIVREGCLVPNPDFTGNVPHRRCETCKWWERLVDAMGECRRVVLPPRGYPPVTDLSVCSNWSGAEVVAKP